MRTFYVSDAEHTEEIDSIGLMNAAVDFCLMRGDKYGSINTPLVIKDSLGENAGIVTTDNISLEIQEMFDELNDKVDYRSFGKPDDGEYDAIPMMRVHDYWKYGVVKKGDVSIPWAMFRMKAKSPEKLKRWLLSIGLVLSGKHSMREVMRLSGYVKRTTEKLYRGVTTVVTAAGGTIYCPCG